MSNIFSKIKNLWYVQTKEIQPKKVNRMGNIIPKNHGGSWNEDKNLNMYLAPVPKDRIVQDTLEWRASIAEAEHPMIPYRYRMQIAYMDSILDPFIRSCWNRRLGLTLFSKFVMVDEKGAVNKQWTKYFEKSWFKTYCKYTLEAIMYGYTLISMGDIIDNEFVNIVMIPRTHISPDRLVVTPIPRTISGEKFMETPYFDSHIWVSTPDEHGLAACGYGMLYELTLLAIALRNLLSFNSQFVEIFGMPFRVLKSDKTDKDSMKRQQAMLESVGSLGYGIIGKDDNLEFLDVTKGQGYKAYGDLENRLGGMVSRIILGHEDAMSSTPGRLGSSQGDAAPQSAALYDTQAVDRDFLSNEINTKLIPFLRRNGIMVPDGLKFKYLNDIEQQEEEQNRNDQNIKLTQIIGGLKATGYEIDPTYLEETMGFKLIKIEDNTSDKNKNTNGNDRQNQN